MRRRRCLAVGVTLAVWCLPLEAQLGGGVFVCTNCSDEGTTLAMKTTQAMQYLKEAQTALNAINMANMMIRQGVNLVEHPSTNIMADLGALSSILVASEGLAGDMARMDAMFRGTYAPYSPSPVATYAAAYNNWATITLKTINGSLNAAGYQGGMLANEQVFMSHIQRLMSQPQGQMEALQLGEAIGTEEVAQLQKLRQLMVADMQSKAAFTALQVNTQQQQQAAQQSGMQHAAWTADPRGW